MLTLFTTLLLALSTFDATLAAHGKEPACVSFSARAPRALTLTHSAPRVEKRIVRGQTKHMPARQRRDLTSAIPVHHEGPLLYRNPAPNDATV